VSDRSVVINHVLQTFPESDCGVAYVYCNYKEQDQTAVNLVASLLEQIISRQDNIPDNVVALHEEHSSKRTRPSIADYSRLLQKQVNDLRRVFIIIDALDECLEIDGTRDAFLAEVRQLLPTACLLVTSRHIATIENDFQDAARIEIRARDGDMRAYIDARIQKEKRLKLCLHKNPDLRLADIIVEKAQGMYEKFIFSLVPIRLLQSYEENSRRLGSS
jgi:hypothetical protein